MDIGSADKAFTIVWYLAAALTGIIGNRTDAGVLRGISRFTDKRTNHDIARALRDAWKRAVGALIDEAISDADHSAQPFSALEKSWLSGCRKTLTSETVQELLFPEVDDFVVDATQLGTVKVADVFGAIRSRLEATIEWNRMPARVFSLLRRRLVRQIEYEFVENVKRDARAESGLTYNFFVPLLKSSGITHEKLDEILGLLQERSEKLIETERLAYTLHELAVRFKELARYEEAEPLFRLALSIGEKTLGSDHPDVGTWLNTLAVLLGDTGRFEEAEPLCHRALKIFELELGPDHPGTITIRKNWEFARAEKYW